MRFLNFIGLILALVSLQACGSSNAVSTSTGSRIAPVSKSNPASVYCADLGGKLEMRQEQAGEAGYCHLPDGSSIEEWKLYRDNNPL